ncbi:helicase-associated domain-containing protein [Kocuria oceani]|uniref:Helicase-associated domain-containing protein n=1 Tax=Kocuria oceani TaxID=988827 RepID=A0ABV9TDN6_9MICC|nr:helicase-associated domain-containing protein [Kocuria oceani]
MVPDGLLRDLAARSPGELAALLDARPDAVRPGTTTTAELAEALLSRAGLSRALDELSRPELDALERAVVLGTPDGPAGPLLAAPPWDRLHRLALVHRDGNALRLVPGVAEALGRYPAGLGRPHRVLAARAARLRGGEPAAPASPASPAEIVRWPAPVREVLERFRSRPVGLLPDALRRPDPEAAAAARPVDWLLARGVLLPVDSRHVELPREFGLALRGGDPWARSPQDPPLPPGTRVPDRLRDNAAAAAVEQVLRRLAALRAELRERPLTTLRAGGIGVRELRRLRTALALEHPELVRLLGLAELAGLVELDPDTSAWRPAPAPFEDAERPEQWLHVVSSWWAADVVPSAVGLPLADGTVVGVLTRGTHSPEAPPVRRALLRAHADLAEAAPGGHAPEDVLALARWQRPRLARPLDRWGPGMLAEAAELGLVGADALSPAGRAVAAGRAEEAARAVAGWLPAPARTVLLQGDLTATATGYLAPPVARALGELADAEGHGPAARHRFTERSLHRALDAGWDPESILAWLAEHSRGPVPQALAYLVEEAGRDHGRVRITPADWVLTGEQDLLEALARSPRLAGHRLRRPAPGVLVVTGDEPGPGRRRAGPARGGSLEQLVAAVRATGTEPAVETVRPAPPPSAGDAGPDLLPQAPAPRHPGPSAEEVEDLLARLTGADDVPPPPDRTDPAGEH